MPCHRTDRTITNIMEIEYVKSIANPILSNRDLFLVDLKVSRDNVIELFVDSLNGVNIQTCIEVSREIESHMNRDEEDFELTVSSAGIGYPFKVDGQFTKNRNKSVEAKFKEGKKINGLLKAFDSNSVTIEYETKESVEGSKKKQLVTHTDVIQREDIKEIRDVVKF